MPINIKITTNANAVRAELDDFVRRQIPFATARALTDAAKSAVGELRREMPQYFDRPTPYTLNAFYVKPATKAAPVAEVRAREFAGKGTPAYKYLEPETFGGERNVKRFERRLSDLSGGRFVLPSVHLDLDQFGNIPRRVLTQALAGIGAFADTGQNVGKRKTRQLRRNKLTVAASRHRSNYFVARSKRDGQPLGIYRLVGRGHVEPVLIFTRRAPHYGARFPFEKIVTQSVAANWSGAFDRALAAALQSARR